MRFVSYEDIIRLPDKLIDRYGGLSGIRDNEILKFCVEGVFQTFGGKELYPDDIIKLGFSLAEGSLSKIDYKNFILTKIIRDA